MRPEDSLLPADHPIAAGTAREATAVGDANPGDANVERLLNHAYQPEVPAADFVARMGQAVAAAAETRRKAFAEAPTPARRLPGGEVLALRPWQILLGWAAAILLLVGTIALVNPSREPPEPV